LGGRNFLFRIHCRLHLSFGFFGPAIEFMTTIQAPVGKGDGLAVATLEALKAPMVFERQRLTYVSHMLAKTQAGSKEL